MSEEKRAHVYEHLIYPLAVTYGWPKHLQSASESERDDFVDEYAELLGHLSKEKLREVKRACKEESDHFPRPAFCKRKASATGVAPTQGHQQTEALQNRQKRLSGWSTRKAREQAREKVESVAAKHDLDNRLDSLGDSVTRWIVGIFRDNAFEEATEIAFDEWVKGGLRKHFENSNRKDREGYKEIMQALHGMIEAHRETIRNGET